MLIDTGGNISDPNLFSRAYRPFLSLLNLKDIDAVIISHHHPDHYRALEDLLSYYNIKHVYVPPPYADNFVLDLWKRTDFQLHTVMSRTDFTVGDISFTLLPQNSFKKENDRSLWAIVRTKGTSLLFTGDSEKKAIYNALKKFKDFSADIVKVPHHGAKSSFVKEFYTNINPSIAIITVGRRNPWHFPSKEVLDFLKANKIKVFRTDLNGQILITFENKGYVVKTYQ
ncbi:MAG: ComEC/Rec2 family competence protein [bacterium]